MFHVEQQGIAMRTRIYPEVVIQILDLPGLEDGNAITAEEVSEVLKRSVTYCITQFLSPMTQDGYLVKHQENRNQLACWTVATKDKKFENWRIASDDEIGIPATRLGMYYPPQFTAL